MLETPEHFLQGRGHLVRLLRVSIFAKFHWMVNKTHWKLQVSFVDFCKNFIRQTFQFIVRMQLFIDFLYNFNIVAVPARTWCATWWIPPLFTMKLSLHRYSRFRILVSPNNNRVSDSYSDGGDVAVATAKFTWAGTGVGAGGRSGCNSANVLLIMVVI
jgi:hypothetical protein